MVRPLAQRLGPGIFLVKNEVNFFVMGANEQRDVEWPPSNLEAQDYYLDSRGKSNSSRGDGKLVTRVPMGMQYDQFDYDPGESGAVSDGSGWIQLGGPDDYRAVELREDVLVYTSDPLDCNLTVVGPIVVHLFAASSGVDTDFTARLIDVHPNGFAMRLNDGIVLKVSIVLQSSNSYRVRPNLRIPHRLLGHRV